MQLHYKHMAGGNFGDDLNPLLWPELFPDIADHHAAAHLYGVGTLLGGSSPEGRKLVLGSGSGYRGDPVLGPDWTVYWVRGPLTAEACGLDRSAGMGDGAVLWSGLRRAPAPVRGRVGLVPHCKSWTSFDWERIASEAGLFAIDPRQTPTQVAEAIASCERVSCESLHAAIFADAMGVPWRAVVLARRFNDFKWRDWLDGLGVPLAVEAMPVELLRTLPWTKSLGNLLARAVDRGGPDARNRMRPLAAAPPRDVAAVVARLRALAADLPGFIVSPAARREAQRDAMSERCAAFARDFGLRFAG